MKKLIYWTLFLVVLAACSKDDNDSLELSSDNTYNLDNNEHVLRIGVNSNSDWTVSGAERWCSTRQLNGDSGDSLIITVTPNIAPDQRSVTLSLANKSGSKTDITIRQAKRDGEYHFRLPVIFHVLYLNPGNPYQNIPANRIEELLDAANSYYRNYDGQGGDMNLTFELATRDPDGNPLDEAGIHRVQRYTNYTMECEKFLENQYGDIHLMWDPNNYINVFLFEFSESDGSTTGISFLPFTPSSHSLAGLTPSDSYYTKLPTKQVYGVALNNRYINKLLVYAPNSSQDIMATTLTHELGHYLGLYHVFSIGEAVESDYCDDTPDYNRQEYMDKWNQNTLWSQAIQRTDRNGAPFTSTNIMDYDFSEKNRFTNDQRTRVRHVLEYSPLIPGPKMPIAISRGADMTEKKAITIK